MAHHGVPFNSENSRLFWYIDFSKKVPANKKKEYKTREYNAVYQCNLTQQLNERDFYGIRESCHNESVDESKIEIEVVQPRVGRPKKNQVYLLKSAVQLEDTDSQAYKAGAIVRHQLSGTENPRITYSKHKKEVREARVQNILKVRAMRYNGASADDSRSLL